MGLLAKRILRDPHRRLEADRVFAAAVQKNRDASQTSNPDEQSRIPDTESSSTNNESAVQSIHEELIPACLRSYLPQPEGGYWNKDVNKKRKRQSTDRLFESVTDDVVEKALVEHNNEAKPAFRIPRKPHLSNPPNGPRETNSFIMSKKRPASMTNLPIATKSNTAKKRCVSPVGPNKPDMNLFEAMNPRSNQVAFPDRSPSSFSIQKPPSIGWKPTSVPMQERKKKKKKKKKIPKRKVKLEEEIANQQLADFFRVSVQAAEDFMNTEQGSSYRSKGDIGSPVILL